VNKRDELTAKIERLKQELRELNASLPAHSVRPHQLIRIEELEEEIEALEGELKGLKEDEKSDR
jgi:polyhydroxyalkanoate synthesis regulator phasin